MKELVLNNYKDGPLVAYEWDIHDPKHMVVLIHGIGEYAARYNRVASEFNKNGIAVFSMDLKGHGISYGKRGHCAPRTEVFRDIDLLIEYAKDKHPDAPIVLYGHSMGGNISLNYRYNGKLNSLMEGYIISAPWVTLVRPVPSYQYKSIKVLSKIFPQKTISSKIDEKDLGNLKNVKGYNKDPLVHEKISFLCALEGFEIAKKMANNTITKTGEGSKKPMLLMHGDADVVCSVMGSRQIKENEGDICTYVEWEGLSHEIHNGGKISEGNEVIAKAIEWIQAL
ncbi:MAG: alpha/beta hydrolase [Anaerovoracaceae bacterium]